MQMIGHMLADVLAYRNLAKQAIHSDVDRMAVIDDASELLKVNHISVCSYYGCGGVLAAIQQDIQMVDELWMKIEKIAQKHALTEKEHAGN